MKLSICCDVYWSFISFLVNLRFLVLLAIIYIEIIIIFLIFFITLFTLRILTPFSLRCVAEICHILPCYFAFGCHISLSRVPCAIQ